MASELTAMIDETWRGPKTLVPPPELGPTGKWVYEFETQAETATRVYKRHSTKETAPTTQEVLALPPDAEVISMSLTPDESCIACLLQAEATGEQDDDLSTLPVVKLRSIDDGRETVLIGVEWLGDIVTEPVEIASLEWGPILHLEQSNSESTANTNLHCYSLYLLLSDHQGRTNQVVLCQIDPSTLELIVPPIPIYSSKDPAVMVDIQRTKGCSYVAIRALVTG